MFSHESILVCDRLLCDIVKSFVERLYRIEHDSGSSVIVKICFANVLSITYKVLAMEKPFCTDISARVFMGS